MSILLIRKEQVQIDTVSLVWIKNKWPFQGDKINQVYYTLGGTEIFGCVSATPSVLNISDTYLDANDGREMKSTDKWQITF